MHLRSRDKYFSEWVYWAVQCIKNQLIPGQIRWSMYNTYTNKYTQCISTTNLGLLLKYIPTYLVTLYIWLLKLLGFLMWNHGPSPNLLLNLFPSKYVFSFFVQKNGPNNSMHFHYKSRFITKVCSDLLSYFIHMTLRNIGGFLM